MLCSRALKISEAHLECPHVRPISRVRGAALDCCVSSPGAAPGYSYPSSPSTLGRVVCACMCIRPCVCTRVCVHTPVCVRGSGCSKDVEGRERGCVGGQHGALTNEELQQVSSLPFLSLNLCTCRGTSCLSHITRLNHSGSKHQGPQYAEHCATTGSQRMERESKVTLPGGQNLVGATGTNEIATQRM